jgi:tight adherence protein C
MLFVASGCAAIAAAAATAWVLRIGGRPVSSVPVPETAPAWIRGPLRLSAALAPVIEPLLPGWLLRYLDRRLQSLGLDDLRASHWVAASLLSAGVWAVAGGVAARASGLPALAAAGAAAILAAVAALRWPERRHRERDAEILRTLPSYLDLLTICVEAGSTLTNGVRIVMEQAPGGPLQQYFARVLREIRTGRSRVEAFRRTAEVFDSASLTALSAALIHSESSGMSLGELLRAQARQRGAERFTRAERQAMQAPVRLLAPLVLFIFPCTFIVIALPIIARVLELAP